MMHGDVLVRAGLKTQKQRQVKRRCSLWLNKIKQRISSRCDIVFISSREVCVILTKENDVVLEVCQGRAVWYLIYFHIAGFYHLNVIYETDEKFGKFWTCVNYILVSCILWFLKFWIIWIIPSQLSTILDSPFTYLDQTWNERSSFDSKQ